MSTINEGGPAFAHGDYVNGGDAGMSVRDYVAAHALNGMLAHSKRYRPRPGAPENWHDAIAEEAFQIADAFIKAREATR